MNATGFFRAKIRQRIQDSFAPKGLPGDKTNPIKVVLTGWVRNDLRLPAKEQPDRGGQRHPADRPDNRFQFKRAAWQPVESSHHPPPLRFTWAPSHVQGFKTKIPECLVTPAFPAFRRV